MASNFLRLVVIKATSVSQEMTFGWQEVCSILNRSASSEW